MLHAPSSVCIPEPLGVLYQMQGLLFLQNTNVCLQQGSFIRLYYPCESGGDYEKPLWIPRQEYYSGLANFLQYNRRLVDYFLQHLYGSFKIPVEWNAPFKADGKYPLIIFSHGLGAFRTLYSAICIEVASQGFIVAAVEHRDESASATYYYEEKSINEVQQQSSSTSALPTLDQLEERWIDYKPHKLGTQEFPFRNHQVHQRAEECIRALDLMTDIDTGKSIHNVLEVDFDFTKMKDAIDLCKVAIMGHSFGGATAIETLGKDQRFKCGVALDAWMFPLDDETYRNVQKPILFINSEKFQWPVNILNMKKLDSNTIQRKMITIMGTVHQSFPDFTFLTGSFLGKLFGLKGTTDPEMAVDISDKASLAFLQRHLGLEKSFDQWDPLIDGIGDHVIPGTNLPLLPLSKH
uniref:Platelet-activating factor acetylhydrolase n=1 Tax=Callorhinchus milii TaxID=7868 RepID=A0A4W3HTC3_CALMI